MAYLRRAGVQWERRVRKSLNAMCNELQVTLQGQPRTNTDKEELLNKWDELGSFQIGKSATLNDKYVSKILKHSQI